MNERISVLLPVYNSEKYIEETLDSILMQDYDNFELIIVNDGSTDKTFDIISRYKDERITLINQENRGVGYTRNRLIALSSAPLILFVDSDDILSSSFISSLYRARVERNADVVVARVVRFHGKKIKKVRKKKDREFSRDEFLKEMVRPFGLFCYPHSRLMERELFSSLSFPEDRIFEDVFLMPHVIYRAKNIYYKGDAIYNYRYNREGLSHASFSLKSLDEMDGYLSNINFGLEIKDKNVTFYSALFFLSKYYFYFFKIIFGGFSLKEYKLKYNKEKKRVLSILLKGKIWKVLFYM